jgi:hypothetical protein
MFEPVVCPLCLTMSCSASPGDICESCEEGELISWDEYKKRMNSSFMSAISEERHIDE